MILLKQSYNFLAARSLFRPVNISYFSEYFRQKDLQDMWQYNDRKIVNRRYRSLIALWKKPLQKKRLRQARIKQIKSNLQPKQHEVEKLVVHNPALGIETKPNESFAVFKVGSRQYKVTNDCMVLLDKQPEHEINAKIVFNDVLLVGTQTYTALGRPYVTNASVEGIIESISLSQKIIVFKKKRRKQYRKSFGSRIPVTSVRITNIVHNLTQQILQKAVPLQ